MRAKDTPARIADIAANSLVLSNRRGHDSHGVIRVPSYYEWIDNGWVVPAAEPNITGPYPHTLRVDGNFGFGQ